MVKCTNSSLKMINMKQRGDRGVLIPTTRIGISQLNRFLSQLGEKTQLVLLFNVCYRRFSIGTENVTIRRDKKNNSYNFECCVSTGSHKKKSDFSKELLQNKKCASSVRCVLNLFHLPSHPIFVFQYTNRIKCALF